ncbi:outer membrane beta-barrel protein [Erythrobacter sp. BLCC-B19]|uniref:outer membrane beta-barrel protein n=1 Tax=Erythrobacter sp. BLCC-B19 TaxID=3025315 RepID=UPI0023629915|nr:outer membrane beta-barrel protein [Erythrobacter sp. BLCC-B19]WDA40566.1 outer membrane beta-barrel protein [Erythrobacter sp. BLCC-B19]
MNKIAFTTLAAMGAIALPAAAQAQTNDDPKVETYVGATAGIHDLGIGLPNDDGGIYGVVAGVDVPVGKTFFVGAEGNYNIGDGAIDSEYGIAARAGVRVGETGKVYVRGGYQEVDFDLGRFITTPVVGLDDTDGDYLVGAGVEFGLGDSPVRFRAGIDTIAFDSTRATVGVLFGF